MMKKILYNLLFVLIAMPLGFASEKLTVELHDDPDLESPFTVPVGKTKFKAILTAGAEMNKVSWEITSEDEELAFHDATGTTTGSDTTLEYTFDMECETPGEYDFNVKATIVEGASELEGKTFEEEVTVIVMKVDLDVDTDRDVDVDDDDEADEDTWSKGAMSKGAIVLPNSDDDNRDGIPDNWVGGDWDFNPGDESASTKVDADPDKADLAPLWGHKLGVNPLPTDVEITLKVSKPAGEPAYFAAVDPEDRLRIFLPSKVVGDDHEIQANDDAIIGPDKGAEAKFVKTPGSDEYAHSIFAGDGVVKFGVEGIEFGAMVDIEMTVKAGGVVISSDKIRLRVAPYVINNHLQPVNAGVGRKTAYMEDLGADNADCRAKLKLLVGAANVHEATVGDRWQQDGYEIGYVKAPYGEMPVVLVSGRALQRGKLLAEYAHNTLMQPGFGVCWRIESHFTGTEDSFGNFESRPQTDKPGDFFYGEGMNDDIEKFVNNGQAVNPKLDTDTDWLQVKHVDEVISFCSDGTHTVVADPEVCWALLLWANQVDGTAKMLQGMVKPYGGIDPAGVTVNSIVVDTALRNFNLRDAGAGAHVMKAGNLPKVRADAGLPVNEPESKPTADGGNAGGTVLKKGGAFIGFFPGAAPKKRLYKITFTSATDYKLEYKEDGAGAWTLDRAGAKRANDEIFTDALCFVFKEWWDISGGAPAANDVFEFSADPGSSVIEMPVLFRDNSGDAINLSNNHANSVVNGNKVLTPESFGPNVDYRGTGVANILGDYVESMFKLAGYATVITADDREAYSNLCGSLHCGSNLERTIPTFKWWEK